MIQTIATRRFDLSDQTWFARISGDANPIHVDPVAARRTVAGEPVVHGIHALLWAIDSMVRWVRPVRSIAHIRVEFERFIFLGQPVGVSLIECSDDAMRAQVSSDGLRCMRIEARFQADEAHAEIGDVPLVRPMPHPAVVSLADIERCSGRLAPLSRPQLAEAFPHASSNIGLSTMEALTQVSALVGMVCPGLHSLLTGLSLDMSRHLTADRGLRYLVRKAAPRYRLAELAISGGGLRGTVNVAFRPAPVESAPMTVFRSLVREGEFSGVNALVLGGSRGLGAVTAKAIVSGGGNVTITYRAGVDDARRIAGELGSRCAVFRYDACQAAAPQFAALTGEVNRVFYFPTPKIFRQRAAEYEAVRLEEFRSVYVRGFEDACTSVIAKARAGVAVFYPSSEALENPTRDTREYCIAKREGEDLCARLVVVEPRLRILVRRLPRISTDQTATLLPARSEDPIASVLSIVREMESIF